MVLLMQCIYSKAGDGEKNCNIRCLRRSTNRPSGRKFLMIAYYLSSQQPESAYKLHKIPKKIENLVA